MKTLFVGLDVSKDDFKAAVKDDQNNLVMPSKCYKHDKSGLEELDRDLETLKEQFECGAIFGMEATGIYHLSVYQHLIDRREHVKVFNGLELKGFKGRIRKTKTDNLDALAISEALLLAREPRTLWRMPGLSFTEKRIDVLSFPVALGELSAMTRNLV